MAYSGKRAPIKKKNMPLKAPVNRPMPQKVRPTAKPNVNRMLGDLMRMPGALGKSLIGQDSFTQKISKKK